MCSRSIVPLDPTRLRELVSDIKELIERVSALVDVDVSGGVPDLRGIIDRLSVGDIGDFRSAALSATSARAIVPSPMGAHWI